MLFLTFLLSAALSQSTGCGKTPPTSGKKTLDGREYYMHIPKGYNSGAPSALVVLFHGWGYSGQEWYQGSGSGAVSARPASDKHNFILVAPTGVTDSHLRGNCDRGMGYCSWNGAGTTGSPGPNGTTCDLSVQTYDYCYKDTCDSCADKCWWTSCTDDHAFVHKLLDAVEDSVCVDTNRVYAGGESNGGVFTWHLGMSEGSSRFAAITPWIGLPHRGFQAIAKEGSLPVMGIWGNFDRTIPPGNDKNEYTMSGDGWYYMTGRTMTALWAGQHGCHNTGQPLPYSTSFDGQNGLKCTAYSEGCSDAPVVDCRFNGNHEVLSYAPELMWEFMSKHTRKSNRN